MRGTPELSMPPSRTQTLPLAASESRALDLIAQALDIPPGDRERFLREKTAEDPELLREVEALIPDLSAFRSFLEAPPLPSRSVKLLSAAADIAGAISLDEPIGDFVPRREIGQGGFALVYLARQLSLDRDVALKISPALASASGEAKVLALLDHDHIVRVYSETIEDQRNLRLIAMQYIDGLNLAELMDEIALLPPGSISGKSFVEALHAVTLAKEVSGETRFGESSLSALDSQETILRLGEQLADALDYAHRRGVLHLDIKPSNILLNRAGRPFLTDFNISVDPREGDRPRVLGGTLSYMAPEQEALFRAGGPEQTVRLDPRTDVYALGVVLRELFQRVSDPRAPRTSPGTKSLPATIDMATRLTIRKATAPEPERRFASAKEFGNCLAGCLELHTIQKSMPAPGVFLRFIRRFPFFSLAMAWSLPLVLATGLCLGYGMSLAGAPPAPAEVDLFLGTGFAIHAGLFFLWRLRTGRWKRYLAHPTESFEAAELGATCRRQMVEHAPWTLRAVTFLWLPVLLALFAHWPAVSSPPRLSRLILACPILGLTGLSYSILLSQTVLLLTLYPRYWMGAQRIAETARDELAPLLPHIRIFHILLVLLPFSAAVLTLGEPPKFMPARWPVAEIGMALTFIGGAVGFALNQRLTRFAYVFGGPSTEERKPRLA